MNRNLWSLVGFSLLLGVIAGCQEKSRSYSERVLRDTLTITESETTFVPTPPPSMVVKVVGETDDLQEEILRASLSGQPTALMLTPGWHMPTTQSDNAPLTLHPGVSLYGTPGKTRIERQIIADGLSQGEKLIGLVFTRGEPQVKIKNCQGFSLQFCLNSNGSISVENSTIEIDHNTQVNRSTGLLERPALQLTNSHVTISKSVFQDWGVTFELDTTSSLFTQDCVINPHYLALGQVLYGTGSQTQWQDFGSAVGSSQLVWANYDWSIWHPTHGSGALLGNGEYAGALPPMLPTYVPNLTWNQTPVSIQQTGWATVASFTQTIFGLGIDGGWWHPTAYRFELIGASGLLEGRSIRLLRSNSQVTGEVVGNGTLRETYTGSNVYYLELYGINLGAELEMQETYAVQIDLSGQPAPAGTPILVQLKHLNWIESDVVYAGTQVNFDLYNGGYINQTASLD